MLKVETPVQLTSKVLTADKALLFLMKQDCPESMHMKERLEMIQERNPSLIIASADMAKVPKLAVALGVSQPATVVLFRRGKRSGELTGRVSARQIQALVDSVFW